jgi:asparagine synthetase B (glutamine-hydrolysing)
MTLNPEKLRDLLTDAVEAAYEEGSSIGVLLSGGIDSSTVAMLAPELPVFTGYYQGFLYDERPWARIVAQGREWHEIEITPQDFIDNIDACLRSLDPPFEGPGTFGQYMVAQYVSEEVETVLSGEGGDELFGGYARLIAVAGLPMPEGYENYRQPEGYPETLEEALAWEWEHLSALLRVDEQVTKAHGLKAKAPMAEYQPLIDYVMSLEPMERVGKAALKQAMRGLVPDGILERKDKKGFPVPYVEWAQGPLRDFIGDRIGYVPDADKPWDRKWWLDLCAGQTALV